MIELDLHQLYRASAGRFDSQTSNISQNHFSDMTIRQDIRDQAGSEKSAGS